MVQSYKSVSYEFFKHLFTKCFGDKNIFLSEKKNPLLFEIKSPPTAYNTCLKLLRISFVVPGRMKNLWKKKEEEKNHFYLNIQQQYYFKSYVKQ